MKRATRAGGPAPADEDSPWKEIVDRYLPLVLALLFPRIHAEIDWSRGYVSLDSELQRITRRAAVGRRHVDKLVQVWRISGEPARILLHLEIQGRPDRDFPERMYVYNYRIFDHYHQYPVSLAVLIDDDPAWRPDMYDWGLLGSEGILRFPTVKLLDYANHPEVLEASDNPFAVIVRAHLVARATRRDMPRRLLGKVELAKALYRQGYDGQEIRELLRFIDWLMALPPEMDALFEEEIERFEKETEMPYIPTYERRAHAEGLDQGLQQGLQQGVLQGVLQASQDTLIDILAGRFGEVPQTLAETIRRIEDLDRLADLRRRSLHVPSLEEFQQLLSGES